jgi:hypothetical protein
MKVLTHWIACLGWLNSRYVRSLSNQKISLKGSRAVDFALRFVLLTDLEV